SQERGGAVQWPLAAKREGSTAGSSTPSGGSNEEKGTVRACCARRVLARLTRMWQSQVLSDERPSKRGSASSAAAQVSWTSSSACAGSPSSERARRNSP